MTLKLSLSLCVMLAMSAHADAPTLGYVSIPDRIVAASGTALDVERGLFFAPENRRKPNSRTIAIHFLRFAALAGPASARGGARPPVFLLPGGPGSEFDFTDPKLQQAVERLRRTRDVVYVSQRGYAGAPGLVPDLSTLEQGSPLQEPSSAGRTKALQQAAVKSALEKWTGKGLDLGGYDILNIVDDVYELRAALGYDKIVLRGCSFGSQWSLAYLKRWPASVDRALLSGVEPLDYAYDSPKWLWASMQRLANSAESDPALARHIPRGGLMKALQTVIERMAKAPVTATMKDPMTGTDMQVVLGADDLRQQIRSANGFLGATRRDSLANWPRFILELYRGDYRYLAATTWNRRVSGKRVALIEALIDNSLGISPGRDAQLLAEPEAHWLGDINDYYHNTRELVPTPDVGDEFRADWEITVPVLLVNGDLDWSTPLENARHLRTQLKSGHLLEVQGATHCTEVPEMSVLLPDITERVYSFIDADFEQTPPTQFFKSLPASVSYPPLKFSLPVGPSLYEQWLTQRRP